MRSTKIKISCFLMIIIMGILCFIFSEDKEIFSNNNIVENNKLFINNLIVKKTKKDIKLLANTNIYDYRFAKEGFIADNGAKNVACGQQVYINYCDDTFCYFPDPSTQATRKGYRNKLAETKSAAEATCEKDDKEYVYKNRYAKEGFIADNGTKNVTCGQSVYIEYCDKTYCYFTDPSTKKTRKGYRNKLAETKSAAEATCKKDDKEYVNKNRYAKEGLIADNGTKVACGQSVYVEYCDKTYCYFTDPSTKKTRKGYRNKLAETKSAAEATCEKKEDSNKDNIYDYRYAKEGFVADNGTKNVACGQSVYIEYCDKTYCYFADPSTKKTRKGYRNKLAEKKSEAEATCEEKEDPNKENIYGYRYAMKGFIADNGTNNVACGQSVYISYCDKTYCYFSDPETKAARYGLRRKLATSYEGAACLTEFNEDRFVANDGSNYSCGNRLYITTCNETECNYTKVNGNNKTGTVLKSLLKTSESVAGADCKQYKDLGDRYISYEGDNFLCGDKLYITKCVDEVCEYTKVNGQKASGTVTRQLLKNDLSAAQSNCSQKEMGTRYVAESGMDYSCGDELHITTCTDTLCNFNKVNGIDTKGTVSRDVLKTDKSVAEKSCGVKGERYVAGSGDNYSCGDELYITTCDNDYCEYTKVNGKKIKGTVDRNILKTDKTVATAGCQLNTALGNRYISTKGENYSCGDELYITECNEGVCDYTKVNGETAYGTVSRDLLKTDQSIAKNECVDSQQDFGNRYASSNGDGYACGDEVYITTCDEKVCNYTSVNGNIINGTIPRTILKTDASVANAECNGEEIIGEKYVTVNGDNYSCGDALYITSCNLDICTYTKIINNESGEIAADGTINIDLLKESQLLAEEVCKEEIIDETDRKCNNESQKNIQGNYTFNYCYEKDLTLEKIKEELKETYICDTENGYQFDETSVVGQGEEICNDKGLCTRTYSMNCTKGTQAKPSLSITSGIVLANGYGTITGKVTSGEGDITSYYVSEIYETPSESSTGWKELTNNTFTVETTPGIKYFWVRDSKGNISNGIGGAVLDGNTETTTIHELKLYDQEGNLQNSDVVSYESPSLKTNKYVMLSNDLLKDSKMLAKSFNPFDMEYKIEVNSPTVSVYATLTSTDSNYVPGYEPRTVNLEYGTNTILIKIQNREGKVRTYTILATRTDDRKADNTLSQLTVSEGKIDFNANVTDYKVEIGSNVDSVNVDAKIGSEEASYVEGYEPGQVSITGNTTVKLIKVKSQTGSTRTYVITFVKKGKDIIKKQSLQLVDLSIPGVYMAFEPEVANYSVSVGYDTETVDINAVLKDELSSMIIRYKRKNDSKYNKTTNKGIALDVGENFIEIEVKDQENEKSYYRITIIRKEFGLGISEDTTLKDLSVLGYNIEFNPSVKEYVVRIKQEKSLVITAVPESNRAEVFIRGNEELTGFSTVRVKVVAENGKFDTYSIDIKKDAFNKVLEIGGIVLAVVVIIGASVIITTRKKSIGNKEYYSE